jgi:hypothetical protein
MDDTPIQTTEPAKAVAQFGESLGDSLAQTAHSHRALVQEMTVFAKDESQRFVNLRLERNGAALDKLQSCAGLPGLISVQQEWLRDFVQDYLGQNMRLAGAYRGVAHNAMASATEAASDNIDRMQQEASDMVHESGEAVQQASEQVEQAVQDAEQHFQATQH